MRHRMPKPERRIEPLTEEEKERLKNGKEKQEKDTDILRDQTKQLRKQLKEAE